MDEKGYGLEARPLHIVFLIALDILFKRLEVKYGQETEVLVYIVGHEKL